MSTNRAWTYTNPIYKHEHEFTHTRVKFYTFIRRTQRIHALLHLDSWAVV